MLSRLTTCALIGALVIGIAPIAQASETDREQAAANFLQADADADGALTLSEFTTLIDLNAESDIGRASMVKRMGRYGTVFGRLDSNKDGLVTTEEMQAVARRAQQ